MKNQRGITLIALVVTIVVLLILAGTSIAMLTGDNGIINRAQQARYGNTEGEVIDKMNLAYNTVKAKVMIDTSLIQNYNAASSDTQKALVNEINKELGGALKAESSTEYNPPAGWTVVTAASGSDKATITITYTDSDFNSDDEGSKFDSITCTMTFTRLDVQLTTLPNRQITNGNY